MRKFKIALLQMKVVEAKASNLSRAVEMIAKAARAGANLIVLPEMFNCPYQTAKFPQYAEQEGGYTWQELSRAASDYQVLLIGGSVPEEDRSGRVYNTSYIFNQQGEQIGKHRKMHLFDINIRGGQVFKESATLTAGDRSTVMMTPYGKMGVMICYDLRFPELARLMVQAGAEFIVVPGAFNMTTGPVHWELLFRARAVDNQVYMIGVAPARQEHSSYVSYGHSLIVDPWGRVVSQLGAAAGSLITEVDLTLLDQIKQELPLLKHRRKDIYALRELR